MRINENLIYREIYGKKLLIPFRRSGAGTDPIFLNDTGAEIWKLAKDGLSKEQAVDYIITEYDLEHGSVEDDAIRVFIDELISRNIILYD